MPLNIGKTLLIRLDRIGDLVLTLPVDESLRTVDETTQVKWWIPKGLGFVVKNAEPPRLARELEHNFSFTQFTSLLKELKSDKPRTAVVFHAPWWVSLLLFLARVPVRAGPKSQWHQILFLNRKLKQSRSEAKAHELEYNFQLAEHAVGLGTGWLPRTNLRLRPSADSVLEKYGLTQKKYIVIHPGMGGSALNWPLGLYTQLINRLTEDSSVVVTGTRADDKFLAPIRASLTENANVVWLDGKINGSELLSVLKNAKACVAPSTGVLHLSASCGTPTVGIFSPVPVQRDTRWGPKGVNVKSIAPQVECPAHFGCLGQKCPHFACMQQISVASVQLAINEVVGANR
jgi:heptosyltransferase I